ncbi:MAG: hypothetical protein K2J99_00980 [Lachnospiraceae bacterium]|nr:hypothetical protein [Lachnospiraceae bacterium]
MSESKFKWAKNKYIKSVISLILSVININLVVSLELWTKSANRFVVMLFGGAGAVVCYLLINRFLGQQERRVKVHALLWGAAMAAAYVLGCHMRRDGTALAGLKGLAGIIVQTGCLAIFAASCVVPFLQGFPGLHERLRREAVKGKKYQWWHIWLLNSGVIFLCWLPVFLAYYPSVFAYDAEGQLYQVIAHDYSTHHPLLHTLFLGAFFKLGDKLPGSYPAGMAVHSVVQMIMMAAVFGYTIAYLYRKGVSAYLRNALLIFYALFPTNSVLAISTTKDVLFSALVLLYTITLHGIITRQKCADADGSVGSGLGNNRVWFLYVLWAVLLLLFRNNALYAFILAAPCVFLGLRRMKGEMSGTWKKYLIFTMAALILFAAGSVSLKAATGAHNGSPREMLSIPLQQMARTRVKAEETLTPAEQQEVEKYLPAEWVFAAYNPYLADPVKNRAVIHDDPAGLIKAWIKMGIGHPQIYIDAFLDNSIGYWFIEDRTHAQIYGIGTESGFGYLSTDNRTMPAGCEITEHSYLPGLRAFMERIISDNNYQKLPVIRLFFAPAFYWWMLCMYMAVVIYRRKYRLLLPVVFLVIYYMTLLLSPTVLIRYMYPFVVTVPAICCCLSMDLDESDSKNIQ